MTNNQLTKEWLQNRIADMESTRDDIPFGFDESGNNELAAFKLALAAMDSEPVAWRVSFTQIGHESNNFTKTYWDEDEKDRWVKLHKMSEYKVVVEPLYRHAQPAPLAPAAYVRDERGAMMLNGKCEPRIGFGEGWNACRAAMLQSEPVTTANKLGNSPVIPDGYVMVPKVPTAEMQSAGASAIRIETTALNKLWTGNAVFRAMLAAAPQEVKGE
ncbi:TPA: hypothetical protein L8R78_000328 [Klebsiella aerogenes]|nr:hypothetical protein [Klebsiella aerogenes]HBS5699524.1 hypothetical protein [Klebsiella aerogenes]